MFKINNLHNNSNMKMVAEKGVYQVFEHEKDLSVAPGEAITAYFSSEMNVRKRQVLVNMNGNSVIVKISVLRCFLHLMIYTI